VEAIIAKQLHGHNHAAAAANAGVGLLGWQQSGAIEFPAALISVTDCGSLTMVVVECMTLLLSEWY
jgi:hypothetical protein